MLPFHVVLIAAAVTMSGCSKSTAKADAATVAQASPQAAAQTAPPTKPVPTEIPEVVARVNGETVTRVEFDRAVSALEARAGGPVPPTQRDQILRSVLDQIVSYKLLVQETATRKVVVPDADVDARVSQIRAQFPNEGAFTEMLAERKLTLEQIKSDAREDVAVSQMIDTEIASKIAVTPAQVDDFYAKNPEQFKQGETVRASHILIAVPRGGDTAAKEEARTKAEQVLKEAKSGKDFATLAKEHSADPGSAVNGGDLGEFQQGQMVGPFNDAAFSLAPGTISDLVETEFGFHIIKVVEKQPARTIPLDDVRPQVEQYLQQQNRQQQTQAFVDSLRAKGKIEVLM